MLELPQRCMCPRRGARAADVELSFGCGAALERYSSSSSRPRFSRAQSRKPARPRPRNRAARTRRTSTDPSALSIGLGLSVAPPTIARLATSGRFRARIFCPTEPSISNTNLSLSHLEASARSPSSDFPPPSSSSLSPYLEIMQVSTRVECSPYGVRNPTFEFLRGGAPKFDVVLTFRLADAARAARTRIRARGRRRAGLPEPLGPSSFATTRATLTGRGAARGAVWLGRATRNSDTVPPSCSLGARAPPTFRASHPLVPAQIFVKTLTGTPPRPAATVV